MPRNRLIAGLLAVLVLAMTVLISTGAVAAPADETEAAVPVAAAAPTTQTQSARTVAINESSNLPTDGAKLTVTGTGFDIQIDAYVAVCAADIKPADDLTYCVGGGIPDDNTGKAWAVVTSDTSGKTNAVEFGADGSFSAELTIDAAVGSSVDCVTDGCVLIVRSVGDAASRPPDITIGLQFVAPSSSSTSTTPDSPSTVGPDTVALPDAYAGQQQAVVFTGFTAGEEVKVTVFSDPVELPTVTASPGGVVAITFAITEALVPGQHTVQAIGQQSGLIGLAQFAVVPAPVVSSSTPESSSSSVSSSAPTSTAEVSTSSEPASTAETTASTTSAADVIPTTPTNSGRNLWWLWVTLILLVVAAGITAAVLMSRRRAQQLEQDRLDREHELADAVSVQPPPVTYQPQPGGNYEPHDPGQSYGLLSGRQGDGPALYSGQGGYPPAPYEPPTTRIPTPPPGTPIADLPTTAIPTGRPRPGVTPPGATPPAGNQPAAGTPTDDVPADDVPNEPPSTERWSPFGDEDEPDGPIPRR